MQCQYLHLYMYRCGYTHIPGDLQSVQLRNERYSNNTFVPNVTMASEDIKPHDGPSDFTGLDTSPNPSSEEDEINVPLTLSVFRDKQIQAAYNGQLCC